MKMKVMDRILLTFYAVLGILALLLVELGVLWPEVYGMSLGNFLTDMCSGEIGKIAGSALVLILIAGLMHLVSAVCRKEVRGPKNSVSVQNAENGAVRVSVPAMDTMVRRAIGNQEGVLDVKSRVVNHDDSITVQVDMVVAMDAHIPNITMIMQRNVKRYIEETSGIAVREVVVLVSEVREGGPAAIPAPVAAEESEPQLEAAQAEETTAGEEPAEADQEISVEPEVEEADGAEEISETDELIAMEEAAQMEEAAVLEEVLAVEPAADDEEEVRIEDEDILDRPCHVDGTPYMSDYEEMLYEGTLVDEGLIEEPETIEIDAEAVTDADEEADKARKE